MENNDTKDTIIALATAAGKAGVAIIRISGAQAINALKHVSKIVEVPIRKACLCKLVNPINSNVIDEAIVIYFKSPNSFTGEDVVEFHVHGSKAVVKVLIDCLCEVEKTRLAEPGEFTKRALLNGKINLLEVEALADLIESETEKQRAQAIKQFSGEISKIYDEIRENIIKALALIEAYIDFPDEDIPEETLVRLEESLTETINKIKKMLEDNGAGERIRDGFSVVILGAPNTGKSTLLNALAKRDVAIVSEIAGTTRDMLEVHMDIGGFPVTLIDTAGIRENAENIEEIGIKRALKRAENADVVLWLMHEDLNSNAASDIHVITKSDQSLPDKTHEIWHKNPLVISAKTGAGLEKLIEKIRLAIEEKTQTKTLPIITRKRHRHNLETALICLNKALNPLPLELKCEEMRLAAREIAKITGKIALDDILDVVFKEFCIGK